VNEFTTSGACFEAVLMRMATRKGFVEEHIFCQTSVSNANTRGCRHVNVMRRREEAENGGYCTLGGMPVKLA